MTFKRPELAVTSCAVKAGTLAVPPLNNNLQEKTQQHIQREFLMGHRRIKRYLVHIVVN